MEKEYCEICGEELSQELNDKHNHEDEEPEGYSFFDKFDEQKDEILNN